jgi:hypothetical protein
MGKEELDFVEGWVLPLREGEGALDYLETRRDRREKTRGINRNACLFLLSFLAFPLSEHSPRRRC